MTSSNPPFPRVLVVNHEAFNRHTCNGIALSNLFAGWPASALASVLLSSGRVATDICNQNWRVSHRDIVSGAFGLPPRDGPVPASSPEVAAIAARAATTIRPRWRPLIGEALFRSPSAISPALRRWVHAFAPDICFSLLGTGTAACMTARLARACDVPVFPLFTDDWMATLYVDTFGRTWLRHSMHHWVAACLARAPSRGAISEEMASEYTQRYGGHFETISNCIDPADYSDAPPPHRPGRPVRLVYAGGLYLDRWQCIADIGAALAALAQEGLEGELLVFTRPDNAATYRRQLDLPRVQLRGWIAPEALPAVVADSDIGVHVESFDPAHGAYTRLSVSTKIPQLMMAGRCILAYGPDALASLRLVERAGAGIVVGRQDPTALRAALRGLLTDHNHRAQLGQAGRRFALAHHTTVTQQTRLRALLTAACHGTIPVP